MVEYILESHPDKQFSQLALSVIAGTLESLVDEATLHHNGHTKLRQLPFALQACEREPNRISPRPLWMLAVFDTWQRALCSI
jgi:hypothetical protein